MNWRSISERARVEGVHALESAVARLRLPFGRPAPGDLYLVRTADARRDDGATWWSLTEPGVGELEPAYDAGPEPAMVDEVAQSLDRIAETIDRLAAQLDAHHQKRAERLEAIEFLLREVVFGGAPDSRTVVLGGVVDSAAIEPANGDITIIAEPVQLEVDTPVEVRSRFHDRWICGFAIAEAIESPVGPCRYRLTRRSDGIPLPILFEACDVRAAALYERQPADQL
jgi:hypothetical protein